MGKELQSLVKTKSKKEITKGKEQADRRSFLKGVGLTAAGIILAESGSGPEIRGAGLPTSELDSSGLAKELASAAKITPQQAKKVLDLLHVNKVPETIDGLLKTLNDTKAVNALGLSQEQAKVTVDSFKNFQMNLTNVRLGIKIPKGVHGPVA